MGSVRIRGHVAGRKPTVSDEEILAILREASDPVLSTSEISEELSIGEKGTYRRLKELEETGAVTSKEIGHSLAWWLAEDE